MMNTIRRLLVCTVLLLSSAAWGEDKVGDEATEARLKAMAVELRCLVCQNESLEHSRADLAVDLRNQIRDMVRQGKNDQQIMEYMVARYGDFVRFRPPLKSTTVPLWFGPFVLMALGGLVLMYTLVRRRRCINISQLSSSEQERIRTLVANNSAAVEEDGKA